jgi:hypothetical protein
MRHYKQWRKRVKPETRQCSVEGCTAPLDAAGYCNKHYLRWKRHGTAHKEPTTPLAERFWRKVRKTDGCWLWTGCRHADGRGQIQGGGGRERGALLTSRLSWELHYGPIPEGAHVLHSCDTPACVRPDHLFLGDHAANMRDRDQKGRVAHGTRHYRSVLTRQQVIELRRIYAEGGTFAALARRYGISRQTATRVARRETYARLT